jgi:hypothetical protein
MMPEFFHHRQPEDFLMRSVDEHMNPNEASEQFSLMLEHIINIYGGTALY